MELDMWLVLAILASAILLFVTEWVRLDIVAFSVVVVLMATNILTTGEALSGFSSPAVLTIGSLFVVGGGILETGLAGLLGRQILRVAGNQEHRLIIVLMITVALLSAFMSDTGTVAVLLPAVIALSRTTNICPSRLLIPLAYGALLGGASTLIGTTPNIIVSDLLRESGATPFGFLDFLPTGAILILLGIIFMGFVGRFLLPERKLVVETERFTTPEELVELYKLPDNLFRLRVRRGSGIIEHTPASAKLREMYGINVLEIVRKPDDQPTILDSISQQGSTQILHPTANTTFHYSDILIVQGTADDISHAAAKWNLGVQSSRSTDHDLLITEEIGIAEALLPPRSTLIGKTITELKFGSRYKLTVLGIHRPTTAEKLSIKDTRLNFGDILLVQGMWKNIMALRDRRNNFVVIGQPDIISPRLKHSKAIIASIILAAMLGLLITNTFSITTTSMLAALAMILTGCLKIEQAYQTVDWKSILLIAGMLPLSIALEKVGLVQQIASLLSNNLGSFGPLAVLAGLFLFTSILTQFLSNTATSVLLAPIALASAVSLNVKPQAFLMAVAIAASMAFASPVASPVNTLVMGAGNYRFGDFLKVGSVMILLTFITCILVLPYIWPLH
jgi:di/tricarboxylate transporter